MRTVYPWQQSQWQLLQEARNQERLPHAILLTGPQGLGKGDFAETLAQSLLCEHPLATGPCGECRYCQLYQAGSHPDLTRIEPLEGKKAIAVDQVRGLAHFMSLTSQYEQYRAVIIRPAEAMNINASNSLLKTLEEPSAKTVLILVSHQPAQLPATIRSRCQEISFGAAQPEEAKAWLSERLGPDRADLDLLLALADQAPLRAEQLSQDSLLDARMELFNAFEQLGGMQVSPVAMAKTAVNDGAEWCLQCLYSWSVDMVRLKSSAQPPSLFNPDLQGRLLKLGDLVDARQLLKLQDEIAQAKGDLAGNVNPNLVMESLFIKWQNCFRAARRKIA